jgi:AcrR family transcriptional regulator
VEPFLQLTVAGKWCLGSIYAIVENVTRPTLPDRPPADRPLRADAARNRTAIVAAAQRAFAESGLQVPFDEIARQAGVGEATLHRRFPGRASLIAAALGDKMTAYAEAAVRARAEPDPWQGFCGYVRRVCAMQSGDRGFADLLTVTFAAASPAFEQAVDPAIAQLEDRRSSALRDWLAIVRRAKAAGRLRRDFHPDDLIVLLIANAGVVAATADTAPDAWQRHIEYMLQAFAADHTQPLPPPAAHSALRRAMQRTQGSLLPVTAVVARPLT